MLPEVSSAANFQWLCRSLLAGRGSKTDAEAWAASVGAPRAVQTVLRTAVGAGSLADSTWAGSLAGGDYAAIVSAFVESLRSRSLFYRLVSENAFVKLPFHTRAVLIAPGATAALVSPGQAVPVRKLQLENVTLEPLTAAAILVVSDELIKNVSSSSQATLSKELRASVSDAEIQRFSAISPIPPRRN